MMKQQNVILEDDLSSASDLHATTVNSCSENIGQENGSSYNPNHQNYFAHPPPSQSQPLIKKKRSLPGNPDPEAEVISLSPKTLMATNRFVCEMCNKGFQRDQNLQLHRRGHNLPWKLKQRNKNEVVRKKVYVCPEVNCVHHEPSRALGDLTGIKKHFCRKHGEKKWKCDKCSKRYAVQSDWKAHSKTCGTREYKCDCGTLFSRRDSFITHRAFCDALAEESARAITGITNPTTTLPGQIPTHFNDHSHHHLLLDPVHTSFLKKEESPLFPSWLQTQTQSQDQDCSPSSTSTSHGGCGPTLISYHPAPSAYMSATALLQKAAQMGTSHLSRGTTLQAPCTTSFGPHPHQHIAHVSANSPAAAGNNTCGTTGSSSLLNNNNGACAGGPSSLTLPLPHHPSSSSFIHPVNMSMMTMMMNEDSFADVSPFDDAFSQMLDAKKEEDDDDDDNGSDLNECHMMMHGSKSGNGGNIGGGVRGNEGMTRDFLGLKDPSHGGDIVIDHTLKQPWHHAK
ncbi:putative transcription factor C2H2 family [Helianthus annuus]|nr:putative transcription factor C2H2 family [Helianthus annuus]KAJ0537146.1 putative transcription factor C2H2 family [Helianthus annuus]KAJ0709667.1 putative transcription factor C2H2 family [Helianthus annuus]KAJ0713541.1 putative transcription factor C2H2 family [Helianthus annuus]KAJ0890925.1 putative transcription factor C2H2 family [Helianthus annuus]